METLRFGIDAEIGVGLDQIDAEIHAVILAEILWFWLGTRKTWDSILVLVTTRIDAETDAVIDAGLGSELPAPSELDQGGVSLSDEEVPVQNTMVNIPLLEPRFHRFNCVTYAVKPAFPIGNLVNRLRYAKVQLDPAVPL